MRDAAGFLASLAGTTALIGGSIAAVVFSEVNNTPRDWMMYGFAIAGGLALMVAGVFLARGRAVILQSAVLVLFLGWCAVNGPGFFTSPGRSRQKRTMADMRTLATALEARATDMNEYPTVRNFDDLVPLLEPTYIKTVPGVDAWQNRWKYESWKEDPKAIGADHYALGSAGRDHKFDKPSLRSYSTMTTSDYDADVVFRDGAFIVYPQGAQSQ
jgi:type II secretory pathway pseudopilin PulG